LFVFFAKVLNKLEFTVQAGNENSKYFHFRLFFAKSGTFFGIFKDFGYLCCFVRMFIRKMSRRDKMLVESKIFQIKSVPLGTQQQPIFQHIAYLRHAVGGLNNISTNILCLTAQFIPSKWNF